eukprot:TRINITY_DN47157_c0_g1_i1.p1 TRINITY_DN47157_c0_g1~~TRINITY_DN47157_c0_g1_i1.p1  ORF type:complete len:951 (-),score=192.66 TRINITY_DN47157_c0_g1_i1:14-2866(-)
MPAESIQVAIRVRPLNSREKDLGDRVAVTVGGGEVCVELSQSAEPRSFTFDYGYGIEATQQQVQEDLGQNLLASAIDGYNSCLFAYGQTGAGKSWSITGDRSHEESRGLLPRISESLVKSLSTDANTKEFQILCTYLEIYQEKMRDLMVKESPLLEVRKHPVQGVFVPGLTGVNVKNYDDIEAVLDTGNSHRQIAATAMNASSSRSHAVFTMNVTQTLQDGRSRCSQLHIVDLAGSERQKKTAAEGDRLKEGAMINQSLTVLGQVIFALAGQATSKKVQHVPFRNSKLTYLLSDSLSGNSRTVMIAAVSPAASNTEETLNTLRFAQSVKKIKTTVSKNEVQSTNKDVMIQQLQQQVADLRADLEAAQTAATPASDSLTLCIAGERGSRLDPVIHLPQPSLSQIASGATDLDQGFDELTGYRTWLEQLKKQMRLPGITRAKPMARTMSDTGCVECDEYDEFTQQYEELQATADEANFLMAWMMEHEVMPRSSGRNDWTATVEWAVKKDEASIKLVGELKAWLQLRDATSDEVEHIMFSCRPQDLKEIVEKLEDDYSRAVKKLNESTPVRDSEASARDAPSSSTDAEHATSHRELVKRATSGLIAGITEDSEQASIAEDGAIASGACLEVQAGESRLKDLEEENEILKTQQITQDQDLNRAKQENDRLKAETEELKKLQARTVGEETDGEVERLRKENQALKAKLEDCNRRLEESYSLQKDFESLKASFAVAQQNDGFKRGSITASENGDICIVVEAEENDADDTEISPSDRPRKNPSSTAKKKSGALTATTHEMDASSAVQDPTSDRSTKSPALHAKQVHDAGESLAAVSAKRASSAVNKRGTTSMVANRPVPPGKNTYTALGKATGNIDARRSVTPGRNVPLATAKKAALPASPAGKAASKQSMLRVPSTTGMRPASPTARSNPFSPKAKPDPAMMEFSANAHSPVIDTE